MIATPESRERMIELVADCYDDPDLFNSAILGRPPYWPRQREMVESVVDYWTTCVYSGNSIGKDYAVAGLVAWWLMTREDSLVIVTGPGQNVLGSVTWKEIRKIVDRSRIPLGLKASAGIRCSPLQLNVRGDWGALGYSTTSVERAAGQHAAKLLVIVEEASGVEDFVWEAIDSLGYLRLVAIGNPIRATGHFVDLIHQAEKDARDGVDPSVAVNAIQIASTESPHAHLDHSPCGMADKTWLDQMARKYGINSLWYRSHVLAIIPLVSAEALIPLSWLDFLFSQTRPSLPANHPVHDTRRLAIDLGEGVGRDSTCALVRDDMGVLDCEWGNAWELGDAAAAVDRLSKKWSVPHERITYDKLGIGRKFHHHLARWGIKGAMPYAGEASPRDKLAFTNLRSEAGWRMRDRLDQNHVPDARRPHEVQKPFYFAGGSYRDRLYEELRPLTYECRGKQVQLLKKADWVIELGHSPDVADTLIQSFAFA